MRLDPRAIACILTLSLPLAGCGGGSGSDSPHQPASVAVDASCGTANGMSLASAPATNLCAVGPASAVSGTGPWTWSCAGSNGGSNASCSASVANFTVTPSGANLDITPATAQTVSAGATASFTVTANSGFTLSTTVGGTCPSGTWNGSHYVTAPITTNCTVMFSAMASVVTPPSGGSVAFKALHTYYISPTGSDSNSGTSPSSPWATPKHPVNCGDVIVASAGNYGGGSSPFGTNNWGAVSNCPSTSGGIDGMGGVYFAILLCAGPDLTSCAVSNSSAEAFRVDASNWAVEGFWATSSAQACFATTSEAAGVVQHHIAFINDVASNCELAGFGSYGWDTAPSGVDQTAAVGVIAYNAAQGSSVCGSGISFIPTNGPDTSSGTHVFIAGAFSYDNINGFCGNRSNGSGSYTTASASSVPGATSITVAATTNWVVGLPIGDLGSSSYNNANPAIPAGTTITSIGTSGPPYAIGLSNAVAKPGVQSGDAIAAMTTTDGEGIIFDTWRGYSYQGVVEQSILWGNGSAGYEMFCNGTCESSLAVHVFNNTLYGNLQDVKHQGGGSDFFLNQAPTDFFGDNNLVQSSVVQAAGSVYDAMALTGLPVVAAMFGQAGLSISGNYFKAAPGASCPQYAVCDSGNDIADYNGVDYASGNFLTTPGFGNPGKLPTTAPSCAGYATTTACIEAAGVVADLMPSGAAAGLGYQAPGPCAADAYFPTWLKGVVHLSWTGSALTENTGLISKPCGM
jgi:hypothetical protein